MAALEEASTKQNIVPFTEFLGGLISKAQGWQRPSLPAMTAMANMETVLMATIGMMPIMIITDTSSIQQRIEFCINRAGPKEWCAWPQRG